MKYLEHISGVIFVVFVTTNVSASSQEWKGSMVAAFFKTKGIHLVDAYLCHSKDAVRLIRSMKQDAEEYSILWRVAKNWPVDEVHEKRVGVFFDASCVVNQRFLNESKKSWYDVVFTWLVWDPDNTTLHKTNLTENISMYSDVVLTSGADFKQVTRFVNKDPANSVHIGRWDENGERLDLQYPRIQPNLHRSVIMGAMFAVQDIYNMTNISAKMQDPHFKHGWDSGNRFFYALGLDLADMYNFTLGIKRSDHWGVKNKNGSWIGIVGDLQRGEADLAFTPMLPVTERLEQSHASPCMQKYWFAVVFKQPRVLGTYKALIMELSGTVWVLVGFSVLAGAIVFSVTMKFTEAPDSRLDMGIVQNIGMFANQGLSIIPQKTSSRIVCLTCMVAGVLVTNYYNVSTLTALLAEAPPAIKNLEDFIDSNIKLRLINATYAYRREWGKVLRPALADKLRKEKDVQYLDTNEGLEAIRKGEAFYAESYILFEGINKNFSDDEKCSITVFSAHVIFTGMRFVRKDKHLLEMIARGLTKIQEHGIVTKERDDWIPGPPTCFRAVPFIQVKLESVSVALGILLAGFILSIAAFVLELLWTRNKRPLDQRSRKLRSKGGLKGRKIGLRKSHI